MAAWSQTKTKNEQASMQVRSYLRALAIRGELKPGGRLPTERQLAGELHISRASLREGIVRLTSVGVLKSVHGVGTFVAADLHYGSLEALSQFYNFPAWQMFEARMAIEPSIASLAAERATKHQIAQLTEEMENASTLPTPERYRLHDKRFHRMVALACGNPILSALIEAIMASTIIDEAWRVDFDCDESVEMHRKIYCAIRARDKAGACQAMEQHLHFSHKALAAQEREAGLELVPASSEVSQMQIGHVLSLS